MSGVGVVVAGEAAVTLRVPVSVFGPVVEDWRGRPVALRWTGHHPEAVSLDILAAEGAASVPQLLEAGARFGIPAEQWVALGDGANDLPMLGAAQLGVGYRAKPAVAAQVDAHIGQLGLDAVLGLLRP